MKKRIVLFIALLLGLASAIAVYGYLQKHEKSKAYQDTVRVVVAAQNIEPRQQIKIEQLTLKEMPREMVNLQAVTSFDQVVGQFARERIFAGEEVLKARLIKGFEDYGIVIKIPEGYRAMSIPVDKAIGVSGFVRPGDLVDVVAGFAETVMGKNMAKVILDKVLVLAIDQELSEEERKPEEAKTVTVAVTPQQAEELAVALDHGVVRLALRPLESAQSLPTEPAAGKGVALVGEKNLAADGSDSGKSGSNGSDADNVGNNQPKRKSIFKPDPVPVKVVPEAEKKSIFKPANQVTSTGKPIHDTSTSTSPTNKESSPLQSQVPGKVGQVQSQIGAAQGPSGNVSGLTGGSGQISLSQEPRSNAGQTPNIGQAGNVGPGTNSGQQYTIEIIRGTERVQVKVQNNGEQAKSGVSQDTAGNTQQSVENAGSEANFTGSKDQGKEDNRP